MDAQIRWLELSRDDFLDAIKRLRPGRMLKSFLAKELQIGLVKGEAIFSVEGATTQRFASGSWDGFVCLRYGMLWPYLKVKPDADPVRLIFDGGRLSIGTARYQARWIDAPAWISQMALEAHFMGPSSEAASQLFCPRCGRQQGISLDSIVEKAARNAEEAKMLERLETTGATHGCASCLHGWTEIPSS